jgi:hypothetical protein
MMVMVKMLGWMKCGVWCDGMYFMIHPKDNAFSTVVAVCLSNGQGWYVCCVLLAKIMWKWCEICDGKTALPQRDSLRGAMDLKILDGKSRSSAKGKSSEVDGRPWKKHVPYEDVVDFYAGQNLQVVDCTTERPEKLKNRHVGCRGPLFKLNKVQSYKYTVRTAYLRNNWCQ